MAGPVIPFKLQTVAAEWGAVIEQPDPDQVVLRKATGGGRLIAVGGVSSRARARGSG